MKKPLTLLTLSAAALLFLAQASRAQTPSCIKASYAGEPVEGVISWSPYQVDPNKCIDSAHAPAGTSHSVDTSGLEPGVSVSFQATAPLTSVQVQVIDDATCPLQRIWPSLSTFTGKKSGTFSLTFARRSGIPNFIGMAQVFVSMQDTTGNSTGFTIYQYCNP
jgi:hypothetical protein